MKTIDQLLMPRYKVIALYPNSPFAIGDVIQLDRKEGDKYFKAYPPMHCEEELLDKFPFLFRKMYWYEDIEPHDYPAFIKIDNRVYNVYWFRSFSGYLPKIATGFPEDDTIRVKWFFNKEKSLPATSIEFLDYIAQKATR